MPFLKQAAGTRADFLREIVGRETEFDALIPFASKNFFSGLLESSCQVSATLCLAHLEAGAKVTFGARALVGWNLFDDFRNQKLRRNANEVFGAFHTGSESGKHAEQNQNGYTGHKLQ